MGAVVLVRSVRAKVLRRRAMRARVGVLEDVLGAAGEALSSDQRDAGPWERFVRW